MTNIDGEVDEDSNHTTVEDIQGWGGGQSHDVTVSVSLGLTLTNAEKKPVQSSMAMAFSHTLP